MTFTFYPKSMVVTAVFLAVFGAMLAMAADVEHGVAVAGVLSVAAYLLIEFFIAFNPAVWWRERRDGHN